MKSFRVLFFVSVVAMARASDINTTPIYQPKEELIFKSFSKSGLLNPETFVLPAFGQPPHVDNLLKLLASLPAVRSVKVAILDSGIDPRFARFDESISSASRSFTGGDCGKDLVGHGSVMALVYKGLIRRNLELVCIQVLRPTDANHHGTPNSAGWGTLEDLLAGLEYASTLNVDIVNLSLVGYPNTWELQRAIGKFKDKGVVVMAAGNNNGHVDSPCQIAYAFAVSHAICMAAAKVDGSKAPLSNWGVEADLTAIDDYTSVAAAYAGAAAGLVIQLLNTAKASPALVKKLLLAGGFYVSSLVGLVGDPQRGLNARILDGDGALEVFQRLQAMRFISYQPAEAHAGDTVTISTSEDPQWLAFLFPVWLEHPPQFAIQDSAGKIIIIEGSFGSAKSLQFVAPKVGDYVIQLLLEGVPMGDKLPIHIYLGRLYCPAKSCFFESGMQLE